jgi:hypothetical protein
MSPAFETMFSAGVLVVGAADLSMGVALAMARALGAALLSCWAGFVCAGNISLKSFQPISVGIFRSAPNPMVNEMMYQSMCTLPPMGGPQR